MIIEYKEERLNFVPVGNGKHFTLKPGTNDVPDKTWKEMEKHLVEKIKNGVIVILQTKEIEKTVKDKKGIEKKEKAQKTIPFKEIPSEEVWQIIAKCNDLDSLEKWRKEETRDEVRAILKDRIDEIEKFIETGKKPENKNKKRNR